jgi:hypothetical protein
MEQNESPQNGKPVITLETILARINIALTKKQLSVQKLQDEADVLEFTEENIPTISTYLAKLNAIDKVTEEVHKETKAPFLEAGRICDAAKNSNLAITAAIRTPVKGKFDKVCADVEKKKKEAAEAIAKQTAILSGIENNVINFSSKIAACATNDELLGVERLINLEKSDSNAKKYGEFHQKAIEKYDTILKPILKDQKEKIKEKEALKKQIEEAQDNDDVEKMDILNEQIDKLDDDIIQNSVKVQEEALNKAPIDFVPIAEEVFVDTKYRRTYTIEIFDEKEAIKKAKDLLEITINKTAANIVLNTLKDTNAFKDKSEIIVNGIKYSEIKNYK